MALSDPQITRVVAATPATIAEAAALIRAGELVAFPTETVYGLGANALDSAALARIFAAKGRPTTDPLIVHVADAAQLDAIVTHMPPLAERLIAAFWPGALTLILTRRSHVPASVSAGLPTVAVRMPAHPVALALIRAAGLPIAAPSANRFAHTSPTTAQHVYDDLAGRLTLILDGGATNIGVESTIVDVSAAHPQVLRPGGVSLEALRQIAPDIEITRRYIKAIEANGEALPAPGMLLKHYAPRIPLHLFEGSDTAVRAMIRKTALNLIAQEQRVGLLIATDDVPALADLSASQVQLGTLADLESVARALFAGLRDLDDQPIDVILARTFPPIGLGLAINDRLLRAAEGKVTHCE